MLGEAEVFLGQAARAMGGDAQTHLVPIVEKNIGMQLTESFAMLPAASVSGLYFAHPEAKYFAVGKIDRDQVEDYARRKGMDVRTVERWLAPNLNYEPAA